MVAAAIEVDRVALPVAAFLGIGIALCANVGETAFLPGLSVEG